MKRSSPLMAFVTGCALIGATLLTASPAHADTDEPLVVCPGQVEQTIDPGLTLLPRFNKVSVHGRFGPCVNQILDDDHVFADYTASASGLISCSINAPITNASGTVRWEDAAGHHTGTSHFTGGITLSQRPAGENVGIVVAAINSGEFAGRTLVLLSAVDLRPPPVRDQRCPAGRRAGLAGGPARLRPLRRPARSRTSRPTRAAGQRLVRGERRAAGEVLGERPGSQGFRDPCGDPVDVAALGRGQGGAA